MIFYYISVFVGDTSLAALLEVRGHPDASSQDER